MARLACGLLTLLVMGCGDPGVSGGVVRFRSGPPVRAGTIEFRSTETGRRYSGQISTDGEFSLVSDQDRSGIPAGTYEVVVVQMVITEDLASAAHQHGGTVPRRYADYHTSGLRTKIRENQESPIMIVLDES